MKLTGAMDAPGVLVLHAVIISANNYDDVESLEGRILRVWKFDRDFGTDPGGKALATLF